MPTGETAEAMPTPRPARARKGGDALIRWMLAITLLAPLVAFAGALGARFGALDVAIGYDLLGLRFVRILVFAGLAAALVAVLLALRRRRGFIMAAAALIIAGGSAGVLLWQEGRLATNAPGDVTSSPADTPPYSRLAQTTRQTAGAANVSATAAACPGLASIPSQVAPEKASAALAAAGFNVVGTAPYRAEGYHEGFWYGFAHDAVIRIRPGQTDVRVTARDKRPQGPVACELARRIATELAS